MTDLVHVEPDPERRRHFARWAVAQNPKLDTVGPHTFAVPADLFAAAPEEILIGSLVDGHPYVSPEEEQHDDHVEELLGVATPEGLAGALDADEPADESGDLSPSDAGEPDAVRDEPGNFRCEQCPRHFATERGRDSHHRQGHPQVLISDGG